MRQISVSLARFFNRIRERTNLRKYSQCIYKLQNEVTLLIFRYIYSHTNELKRAVEIGGALI